MAEKNGLPPPLYPATAQLHPLQYQRLRSAKRKDAYKAKSATAIASLQIVGGILIMLFCLGVAVPMLGTEMESFEHRRIIPNGICLMVFLAITGGIGIGAAKKKTRCLIIAHMVLCILVSISLGCLLMQVIGITIENGMNMPDRDRYSGSRDGHSGSSERDGMDFHEEPRDYMMGEHRDGDRDGRRNGPDLGIDGIGDGTIGDMMDEHRDRDRDGRRRSGHGMEDGDGVPDKKDERHDDDDDMADRDGKPVDGDGKPQRDGRHGARRDPAEYPDDALLDLMDTDESGDYGSGFDSGEYEYYTDCWFEGYSGGSRRKISVAMSSMVLILVVFEFIVTVWGSALACRVTCCAPRSSPVSPSVIYAQSQPPLPVVEVDWKAPISAEHGAAVVVPMTKEQEALGLDPRLLEPSSPPPPY